MKVRDVTMPQIGLIAGTRFALGLGIGLLVGGKMGAEKRSAVGWTLVAVGALTTLPLVADIVMRSGCCSGEKSGEKMENASGGTLISGGRRV